MQSPDLAQYLDQIQSYFSQQAELVGPELFGVDISRLDQLVLSQNSVQIHDLEKAVQNCQKCKLAESRNHVVFGAGNPNANLMLIGEAPGAEEDKQGLPFVGKAGQLLDKILIAIGFKRSEVYIANILKCRPPANRDPNPDEIEQCQSHLDQQIESIQPKIILALGRVAGQTLLKSETSLGQMRTQTYQYAGVPLLVTYHPAALLRNPQWKKPAWEDVQKLRHMYDSIVGDKPAWSPSQNKK
ncbi:uracil-DNA glycosylase [candidate division KSB1 bacterium]|nr:uracil-DNA glycosylase [candidate division KSB1 bacterium]